MKSKKCALITGATGFIGYHLTRKLIQEQWQVHAVVRTHINDQKERLNLPPSVHCHACDCNPSQLREVVKESKASIIFHLASFVQTHGESSELEPLIDANLKLGIYLLEAARHARVPYFVNTGTYWQHYDGKDTYRATNLYAATKQAFEDILEFYRDAGFVKCVTLKLFDVYGPFDTRNKLTQLLKRARETGAILKMTPGNQILNMVHIGDVVDAYLRATELLQFEKASVLKPSYAVRSEEEYTLQKTVRIFERVAGQKLNLNWGALPYHRRHVMKPWKGDVLPGWCAKTSLEDGFRQTLSLSSTALKSKITASC